MSRSMKPETYAEAALTTPLFAGLSAHEAAALLDADGVRVRHYAAGERIYSPTGFSRCLGFLAAGSARVVKTAPDGAQGGMPMSVLHAGELFGAAALFTGEPCYVADIHAQVSTWAVLIEQAALEGMMRADFRVASNYLTYLTARIRFLSARLDGFVPPTVEERVLSYVRANAVDGIYRPEGGLAAMADALRIGRATLYRAFDALVMQGRLTKRGRTLCVGPYAAARGPDGEDLPE